jgi:MoxR-like ATPase
MIRWVDGPVIGKSKRAWVHDTATCRAAGGDTNPVDADPIPSTDEQDDAGLPEVTLDGLVAKVVAEMFKQQAIEAKTRETLKRLSDKSGKLVESLQATVEATINDALDKRDARTIKIIDRSGDERKLEDDHYHHQFEEICRLVDLRRNIYLFGPTGAGKTHTAAQLADACGMPIDPATGKARFGFISCTEGMSEAMLTGRFVPVAGSNEKVKARFKHLTDVDGLTDQAASAVLIAESNAVFEYLSVPLVECWEKGGLFLMDEYDAIDPNVGLVMNAAISNGYLSLPNRMDNPIAKRHPDFVLIVAGNTAGDGGDRQYQGRNVLCASTLRRFRWGMVRFGYDEKLERKLCPDTALFGMLVGLRRAIEENRLERNVCTGDFVEAYNDLTDLTANGGLSHDESVAHCFQVMTLLFTEDEMERTKRHMNDNGIAV